jgi:hypothetical protein
VTSLVTSAERIGDGECQKRKASEKQRQRRCRAIATGDRPIEPRIAGNHEPVAGGTSRQDRPPINS